MKPYLSRLVVFFAILLALFVWGCPKNEARNGVTGHVEVVGGSAAGVKILIYEEPSFGSISPWPTTQTVPAVGFPYRLQAAFDWRKEQANKRDETETDGSGDFRSPNLPDGSYVVIAQKDSFGWSDPVRVDLHGKSAAAGTIRLRPERYFTPNYTIRQDTVWNADGHIVLQGSLSIGASLTIRPGTVIRMKDQNYLRVLNGGRLTCDGTADSSIIFTSDLLIPNYTDWRSIRFEPSAYPPHFRYCSFRYCATGVESNAKGGVVEYCFFWKMSQYGVNLTGDGAGATDSLVVRRCVSENIPNAFRIVQVNNTPLVIEHNAVFGSGIYGTDLEVVRGGRVFCNWYYNCGRDTSSSQSQPQGCLYFRDARNLSCSRNQFDDSPVGVSIGSRVDSSTAVENNRFTLRASYARAINVGWTPDQSGASYPTIRNNCFQGGRYHVFIAQCNVNSHTVDADSNYWGSNSEDVIQSRLWDHDNEAICPFVIYNPYLEQCPSSQVGICGS
jgi:hypothetical protein